jgi:hypothetical protein
MDSGDPNNIDKHNLSDQSEQDRHTDINNTR